VRLESAIGIGPNNPADCVGKSGRLLRIVSLWTGHGIAHLQDKFSRDWSMSGKWSYARKCSFGFGFLRFEPMPPHHVLCQCASENVARSTDHWRFPLGEHLGINWNQRPENGAWLTTTGGYPKCFLYVGSFGGSATSPPREAGTMLGNGKPSVLRLRGDIFSVLCAVLVRWRRYAIHYCSCDFRYIEVPESDKSLAGEVSMVFRFTCRHSPLAFAAPW